MNNPAPFPRSGQIWEVIDHCDAQILYLFSAPITLSGAGQLAAGERVRVTTELTESPPNRVDFLPVRYDELHPSLVPLDIRHTPRYVQYTLSVKTAYFHEHFKCIKEIA